MEQKLYDAVAKLPETSLDFYAIQPTPKLKSNSRKRKVIVSLAVCVVLLISIGLVTVEAKEYSNAIKFFDEYGLSTDGLSRGEIKGVYRDITTKSFTYSKTAEVIANSLSADQIGGYEILQDNTTPEDIENFWNYMNGKGSLLFSDQQGIHYKYRSEWKNDDLDKSFIEKYDGDHLLWSAFVSDFLIDGYSVVSDGVIVYGNTPRWASYQPSYAWIAKIDLKGKLLWERMLDNGFEDEYVGEILEKADGGYAVFSYGDFKCFCLSQYTSDGKEICFKKTDVGNYQVQDAARLGNGYVVQLRDHMTNEYSKIVKVDPDGNITESFSYDGEDAYYYITDMIEYNGNIYLSAYSVPKHEDEEQNAGGRGEIAAILNNLFDNGIWEISSEELTPMVRDNYTAMLLICDPNAGIPQEFYSVKGSLGGDLSLSESGTLLWDVESITAAFFSPYTSSFVIGGTSCVFKYSFDARGALISQEKTGEVAVFRR